MRLTRHFYAAKMEENGDLMKHITSMTSLAEQLKEMKETITSKKFAIVILGSLPESYDNFLTSLNARNADDLDWSNVKSLLVEEYMKREEKEKRKTDDAALFTRDIGSSYSRGTGQTRNFRSGRGRNNGRRNRPYYNNNQTKTCWSCNEVGHVASTCVLQIKIKSV